MDGNQIAEYQCSGQGLVICPVSFRICDDRHADRDSLVSAPGIAHRRQCASRHPGIRRCGGEGHRISQEIIAENLLAVAENRLPDLQPVFALQSFFSQGKVQLPVVQDESYILNVGSFRKFAYLLDSQVIVQCLPLVFTILSGNIPVMVPEIFGNAVEPGFHDSVVHVLDYRPGLVAGSAHLRLYVELRGAILQLKSDTAFGNHLLGKGNSFIVNVLEHFQAIACIAAYGSESGGNAQPYHSGTGYSHPHSVLEDVAADFDIDPDILIPGDSG